MAESKEKKRKHSFHNPDAWVRHNPYGIYDRSYEKWLASDQCPWVRDEPFPFKQYIRGKHWC